MSLRTPDETLALVVDILHHAVLMLTIFNKFVIHCFRQMANFSYFFG